MLCGKNKRGGEVETDRQACRVEKEAAVTDQPSRQEMKMARPERTGVVAGETERSIHIFI